MSRASPGWQPSDDLPDEIGGPSSFSMPEQLTSSTPWERAQTEVDQGGPINDAERMVRLSGGEGSHRVTWALQGQTLLADCDCRGHRFNDGWCAHVASLWWQWVRGRIVVSHLHTGRDYPEPPAWLRFDPPSRPLDDLSPAELDAFLHCDVADAGVRPFARRTDRSPGTIGNLLASAREKLGGDL